MTLIFGNFCNGVSHHHRNLSRGKTRMLTVMRKHLPAGGEVQPRWANQTCENLSQLGGEAEPRQTGGGPQGEPGPKLRCL